MKKNAIYTTLLMLIFSACTFINVDSDRSELIGKWQWVQSTGGFGGTTITPDSTGYSERRLAFTAAKTFSSFRHDTLFQSGIYTFEKEDDDDLVIKYNLPERSYSIGQEAKFSGRDTLILKDECYDC